MLKLVVFAVTFLIVLGILSIAVCINTENYYNEDFERKEKEEK